VEYAPRTPGADDADYRRTHSRYKQLPQGSDNHQSLVSHPGCPILWAPRENVRITSSCVSAGIARGVPSIVDGPLVMVWNRLSAGGPGAVKAAGLSTERGLQARSRPCSGTFAT